MKVLKDAIKQLSRKQCESIFKMLANRIVELYGNEYFYYQFSNITSDRKHYIDIRIGYNGGN